ncbi:hypothetical protein DPMN_158596 [Dreissena polymorpha]|uniref:Glycoside hydrolase family 38 central domain-containing protein n=1 Tax=Dreissena polymorpha TaxID=45954 RepID=A0A9D4EHJ0_DREPO|nr:hypothetical protein DPMN_158596 [Dreissena polymorpha]
MGRLRNARRDVGMFQHHDEITGTSLPFVVSDDEERLTNAFRKAREALAFALNLNASDSGLHHTVSLMYEGGRHIGFGTTFENNMAARRFQT